MTDQEDRAAPRTEAATHELKVWPEFWRELADGSKTFEIRRNDRGYDVGDTLHLREYDPRTGKYSGRELTRTVTYITDFEQQDGYVVLAIEREAAALAAPLDVAEIRRQLEKYIGDPRDVNSVLREFDGWLAERLAPPPLAAVAEDREPCEDEACPVGFIHEAHEVAVDPLEAAGARGRREAELLRKYRAQHDTSCPVSTGAPQWSLYPGDPGPCTCGLSALLADPAVSPVETTDD
jgi:hypothetical protein